MLGEQLEPSPVLADTLNDGRALQKRTRRQLAGLQPRKLLRSGVGNVALGEDNESGA